MGPLTVEDVDTVINAWKYTYLFPDFGNYIRETIQNKTLASLGVRQEDTDLLVGWMLENEDGSLGKLHVLPDQRCKGIGAVLIQRLSEEVLTHRDAVFVDIDNDNEQLVKLSERIGYEIDSARVTWIICKQQ